MDRPVLSTTIDDTSEIWRVVREDLGDRVWRRTYYHKGNDYLEEVVYFFDGVLHKDDGPAVISYDLDGSILRESYYLNGCKCTAEQIEEIKWNMKFDEALDEVLNDG